MRTCEHCPTPGQPYDLRYLSAGERAEVERKRYLCTWHAEQYERLSERWNGVLISIVPSF